MLKLEIGWRNLLWSDSNLINKTMKTLILSVILLSSFAGRSQTWCLPGANWKYSYMNGFGTEGYTQIQYFGDTVINGQLSKILDKHIYAFNYQNSQAVDIDAGKEYTFETNGIVYLWYNNDWDTLYNFNASVGESWRMAKQPFTNACDSNSTLTVTAIGSKVINSQTLNYLVVDFSFPNGFSDTIVEKIGFINSYLLPYDFCNGSLDANEGGPFRCYQDNNFTTYKPHFAESCDFILGLYNIDSELNLQLFPNPASETLTISLPENALTTNCNLLDNLGKEVKRFTVTGGENFMHVSELESGVYMMRIGSNTQKIIIE